MQDRPTVFSRGGDRAKMAFFHGAQVTVKVVGGHRTKFNGIPSKGHEFSFIIQF